MNDKNDFRKSVRRDSEQQNKAEKNKAGLYGFMVYGGTIGLLLMIPIVAGAYFGLWLDSLSDEFQSRWTVSFILIGIGAGIWNVIWYIKERL